MEKIDTDYKQRNLKSLAKLFKPFNRDWAPLNHADRLCAAQLYMRDLSATQQGKYFIVKRTPTTVTI